ncbi:TetR/AcrR family transcriptional regulator [Clostridium akagii]|uniref:TetR/AcrR family transcriptional regulator n=1 Tax=Clostridium akagii TaxID=91623 RepID=UPI00068DC9E6|nr:TetR/AcrR family transcriptional regulator [Clostridium akagii]
MITIKNNTREALISATVFLISTNKDATKITSREIVAEAKTNLAMINYCFKSKEDLMNIAVQRIIASQANNFKAITNEDITPRDQLKKMLYTLSDITVSYNYLTKISVPYILLHDEITHPLDVLPIIKKHFGGERSETYCRIIAYQMISFMQLVFLRADDFFKYSGIDIFNAKERNDFIDMQLNLFLGDEK